VDELLEYTINYTLRMIDEIDETNLNLGGGKNGDDATKKP